MVFPGIFDEGVLDGSRNPDRYFEAKNFLFTPNFRTQPLKSIPVFGPGRQNAECRMTLKLVSWVRVSHSAFCRNTPAVFVVNKILVFLKVYSVFMNSF